MSVMLAAARPAWLLTFGVISLAAFKLYKMGRRGSDLPPGPPTVPVLGNIPLLSKGFNFLLCTAWARQYGEIYSLMGGPTGTTIVLTSLRAIHEVLEKNGGITVDRPQRWVVQHITGGLGIGMSQYNAYWKATRRAAYEVVKPSACIEHLPIQTAEVTQLMFDMIHSPADTFTHINRYASSVMLSVIYGERTPRLKSPMLLRIMDVFERWALVLYPTFTPPVDVYPFLQYIPERWAPWKTTIKKVRTDLRALYFGLVDDCEARLARGEPTGCYMETVLQMPELFQNREQICYFGFSMMAGGITTTAAWMHFLVLCMTTYPDVRKKAQEEIDRIIGSDRTPELRDLEAMPYVQALIKEISRFRPLVPTNLPHVSRADVMYKNYRIPAGSSIWANTWGVLRDESLFKNPDEFDPERYIESPLGLRKEAVIDHEEAFKRLNVLTWGYGRRTCPGINLAQQTLALTTLNLLWAFDFTKARDASGAEIDVDLWAFTKSTTVDVLPFVVQPNVRDPTRADVIRRNFFASSDVFERFERELGEEDQKYIAETRTKIA